ncbi:MAG: response regulator transcription factor [Actinomycetia bacterium]|nr:response regulator transcription factor [Actinomycetes bacterium]MCP4222263.1 response regulator transcription factor [Actinomycetes bacterium]MCP5033225.1 response regulator transcription factor [Actinomycetes bacterium]
MRILVVDDETDLAEAIAISLRREGYAVDVASDGQGALDRLAINEYDLITLDLNLPDIDGREVCRIIRTDDRFDPTTRVLMLTGRDSLDDRVGGLDDGADDYLVKPFALRELSARVRTLLRRETSGQDAVLTVGDLVMDTARQIISVRDQVIALTTKESALLRYFMTYPGEVLSQERLLEHVWDEMVDPFTNTARVTVGTLRRKLAAVTDQQLIETVIGAGYRLIEPGPAPSRGPSLGPKPEAPEL